MYENTSEFISIEPIIHTAEVTVNFGPKILESAFCFEKDVFEKFRKNDTSKTVK